MYISLIEELGSNQAKPIKEMANKYKIDKEKIIVFCLLIIFYLIISKIKKITTLKTLKNL